MQMQYALAVAAFLLSSPAPLQAAPVFKHIVVVIQENRTPDNLFGSNPTFEPGVDIATEGRLSNGKMVPLTARPLADCYDIAHSHASFEAALTHGFDTEPFTRKAGCALPPNVAYVYADNSAGDMQPYFDLALANGFANRMFQTNQGPSFPAHQFLFGGTSAPSVSSPLFAAENTHHAGCTASPGTTVAVIDRYGSETANSPVFPCFEHPTLPDVLASAAVPITWRYYAPGPNSIWTAPNAIRHICQPGSPNGKTICTGPDWTHNVVADNPAHVLSAIAACHLQNVSWVIPSAENSDHAIINTGGGPSWVASIVNAIGSQTCHGEPYWKDTAIFVTWDDWGGWFDHVAPFKLTKSIKWGAGYTYGFRVPLLVVSAYTQPGQVSNGVFDFGSILAFIEHNFGVGFIGSGATVFDRYADYQATRAGRADLATFFTLNKPKSFTPIAAKMTARDFLAAPPSSAPPDDD